MNMIKRALSLSLAVVMMLVLLCACGGGESLAKTQEALCEGKWLAEEQDSEEQALILVEGIDLYEEEIALVDLGNLKYGTIVEFNEDGTYRRYISVEHTKGHVRDFYTGVFDDLYENRGILSDLYGTGLDPMSKDEFLAFYASLYEYDSFSVLMDDFVENAYDYRWDDLENGSYTLKSDTLMTISRTSTDPNADDSGTLPFKLNGDKLTLEYSDGAVVYTKIG